MNTQQTNYQSNPFTIIFKGAGAMFRYNQNLSIILIVAPFFIQGGYYIPNIWVPGLNTFNPTTEQLFILIIIFTIIFLLMIPVMIFLITMYNGISAYTALATSREQTTTLKDAWNATLKKFWVILGIDIIIFLKVLGGLILFIVPGIRAILRYNMVHLFVFDENTNIKDSISKCKELSKDHLMEIFGMSFASSIIPIISSVMMVGGQSVMYPQLVRLKSTSHTKPPVHWLNYLAFMIFGFLLFIMMLILLLILVLLHH